MILARPRDDFYASGHPTPQDALLVIEVSDTTQDYDRGIEAPLYARKGIREFWLVDLEAEMVEVYRRPEGGAYREVMRRGRGERPTVKALPGVEVTVEEILG